MEQKRLEKVWTPGENWSEREPKMTVFPKRSHKWGGLGKEDMVGREGKRKELSLTFFFYKGMGSRLFRAMESSTELGDCRVLCLLNLIIRGLDIKQQIKR